MGRGAIVILVLASLLAACGAPRPIGPGGGPSPSSTETASVSPLPTATPSPSPSASPSPSPSPTATATPLACFPIKGGSAAARATIADVRVGSHPGYDRLVIELTGGATGYSIDVHDIKGFVHSFRGDHVDVAGNAGLILHLYSQDIPPVFAHGTSLVLDGSQLRQVVVLGDFEGQADLAIGLDHLQCPTVSYFDSPTRLVVDFPTG
jgi:hypothetical protein